MTPEEELAEEQRHRDGWHRAANEWEAIVEHALDALRVGRVDEAVSILEGPCDPSWLD